MPCALLDWQGWNMGDRIRSVQGCACCAFVVLRNGRVVVPALSHSLPSCRCGTCIPTPRGKTGHRNRYLLFRTNSTYSLVTHPACSRDGDGDDHEEDTFLGYSLTLISDLDMRKLAQPHSGSYGVDWVHCPM